MEMKMETLALQTQKPTVKKGATDVVQQIKTQAIKENFDVTEWERGLYSNGKVFSHNFVNSETLFSKWQEGVEVSEVMFANYQTSLLYVLQHIYSYYYNVETMTLRDAKHDEVKRIDEAVAPLNERDNSNIPLANKLVKLAWAKHIEKGTIDRKRISTYAKAMENAFVKGEHIESCTDDKGRVKPKHFMDVVKNNGGISSFSRLSKQQIELNKEIADSDYDSVEERTVAEFKQSISNGVFNELGQDINFLNQQLNEYEGLVQNLDFVDDEEFALVLVRNDKGDTKAELVIKDTTIIDTVMLNQSKRMVDSIKAELNEKYKPKTDEAKKAEALNVSKSELKAMEKVLLLATKHGGVDKLMATMGEYQSGERILK
jgi:hypothetical protein